MSSRSTTRGQAVTEPEALRRRWQRCPSDAYSGSVDPGPRRSATLETTVGGHRHIDRRSPASAPRPGSRPSAPLENETCGHRGRASTVPQALVKGGGQRSTGVGMTEAQEEGWRPPELHRQALLAGQELERVTGIEPAWPAWKSSCLPYCAR